MSGRQFALEDFCVHRLTARCQKVQLDVEEAGGLWKKSREKCREWQCKA